MSYQNFGSDDPTDHSKYSVTVPLAPAELATQNLSPSSVSSGLTPLARWILLAVGVVELCFLVGSLLGTWWAFDFRIFGGPPAPVFIQNNHFVGGVSPFYYEVCHTFPFKGNPETLCTFDPINLLTNVPSLNAFKAAAPGAAFFVILALVLPVAFSFILLNPALELPERIPVLRWFTEGNSDADWRAAVAVNCHAWVSLTSAVALVWYFAGISAEHFNQDAFINDEFGISTHDWISSAVGSIAGSGSPKDIGTLGPGGVLVLLTALLSAGAYVAGRRWLVQLAVFPCLSSRCGRR